MYMRLSEANQARARRVYTRLFSIGKALQGINFKDYLMTYRNRRGMDFSHDVHDWLGGYPYESILPDEVAAIMKALGFEKVRAFTKRGWLFGRTLGLMGSGCDEFVYRRISRET